MRNEAEVAVVLALVGQGLNDCAISRATGIPRGTVRGWRIGRQPTRLSLAKSSCDICRGLPFPSVPSKQYAYLLGQYLGDGFIARMRRGVFVLRIHSDMRYPKLIRECADSMRAVMPHNKVNVAQKPGQWMVIISSYSKHWPCLFPQCGPGMKHTRKIVLAAWQASIVADHPEAFLRGLIHSDGCRVINRVQKRKYQYPRYQFSNMSKDIHRMFADACDQLGISWRWSNHKTVSIARRDAVALMDTFVGPKA
jgi:hypothetical protein